MKRFMLVSMVLVLLFTAIPVYAVDFCFWTDCKPVKAKLAVGEIAPPPADIQLFPAELSQYTDYLWRRKSDGGPGWGVGVDKVLAGFLSNNISLNFTYINQVANQQANLYGPTGSIDLLGLLETYVIKTGLNTGNLTFHLGPGVMFDIEHNLHPCLDAHFKVNFAFD
jgi:hypothetical protein